MLRSNLHNSVGDTIDRHPSRYETIEMNRVANVLQNFHTNYGTASRMNMKSSQTNPNLIEFSPPSVNTNAFLANPYPNLSPNSTTNFDPLAPVNQTTNTSSNLIDF